MFPPSPPLVMTPPSPTNEPPPPPLDDPLAAVPPPVELVPPEEEAGAPEEPPPPDDVAPAGEPNPEPLLVPHALNASAAAQAQAARQHAIPSRDVLMWRSFDPAITGNNDYANKIPK
jgi:hypothetical protein